MLFSVSSSARLGGNTEASRPTASAPCGIYLPKPAPGICEQPRNISLKAGRQASACSLSLLQQSLSEHQFDSKLSAKMVFTLPSAQKQQLCSLLRDTNTARVRLYSSSCLRLWSSDFTPFVPLAFVVLGIALTSQTVPLIFPHKFIFYVRGRKKKVFSKQSDFSSSSGYLNEDGLQQPLQDKKMHEVAGIFITYKDPCLTQIAQYM